MRGAEARLEKEEQVTVIRGGRTSERWEKKRLRERDEQLRETRERRS